MSLELQDLKSFLQEFRQEIESQEKKLAELEAELRAQRRELDDKTRVLDLFERKIERLEENLRGQRYSSNTPEPSYNDDVGVTSYSAGRGYDNYNRQSTKSNSTRESTPTRPAPSVNSISSKRKSQTTADTSNNPVTEFNSFASIQDTLELRRARNDFIQKNNVRAFSCTNFEARMGDPIPPPVFAETGNILSSDYWAIPANKTTKDVYGVVPNVKNYTNNHHVARAMGDVFDSNFRAGNTYTKIFVERVAVFSCKGNVWTFVRKGKLRLE